MMNPAQQDLFDLAILRVLDANRSRWGLAASAIGHLMAPFGFPSPDEDTLLDRIDYLVRKKFVEEVTKQASRASRAWRATTEGLNYLDNHP